MSDIQRYEAVSEWSITKDDSGSYVNYDDHAAIVAQLEAALADARKDQARYQYVIDWLESNVIATAAFTHARTKSEYDQAIDAAIKEQQ